jgi:zinc transporter 1/2/3
MFSIFAIFIMEIIAFRWGTAKLQALGIKHGRLLVALGPERALTLFRADPHGHGIGGHAAHGPESNGSPEQTPPESTDISMLDVEKQTETASHQRDHGHSNGHDHDDGDVGTSPLAQLVGIAILEFGVMLHRQAAFRAAPI